MLPTGVLQPGLPNEHNSNASQVLENIFQQDEDAADGFERISFLLIEYRLLEDLYLSSKSRGSRYARTTTNARLEWLPLDREKVAG